MNGRAAKHALLVAAALLLSGCWPARFTYQPGVMGTVIAADDGKPVSGASIRLIVPRAGLVPASTIETASDGTFEAKPYYEWGLFTPLGENWPAWGSVEITATGFAPYTQDINWTKPRTEDLGVIRLVRR